MLRGDKKEGKRQKREGESKWKSIFRAEKKRFSR